MHTTITELHDEALEVLCTPAAGERQQIDLSHAFWAGACSLIHMMDAINKDASLTHDERRAKWVRIVGEVEAATTARLVLSQVT